MTAITVNAAIDATSDATFRNWITVWHNAFSALGWVQTTDTGQLNLGTITKAVAVNTVQGYEIWRMNDSLQSTAPVFVKLEFGSGPSNTYLALWLTVGFSTDGAGNINSTNKSTRTQHYGTTHNATLYGWKFSGGPNRFGGASAPQLLSMMIYMFIERMHNTDGSDNGNGVMVIAGSPAVYNTAQMVPVTGTLPPQAKMTCTLGNIGTGTTLVATSDQWGSNVYLQPVRIHGMGERPPMLGVMGYYATDLTDYNLTTVTNWDGTSVTVFPTGKAPTYMFPVGAICFAMRFD